MKKGRFTEEQIARRRASLMLAQDPDDLFFRKSTLLPGRLLGFALQVMGGARFPIELASAVREETICPVFHPGDVILFLNTTPHRTSFRPGMTEERQSIEFRFKPRRLVKPGDDLASLIDIAAPKLWYQRWTSIIRSIGSARGEGL